MGRATKKVNTKDSDNLLFLLQGINHFISFQHKVVIQSQLHENSKVVHLPQSPRVTHSLLRRGTNGNLVTNA